MKIKKNKSKIKKYQIKKIELKNKQRLNEKITKRWTNTKSKKDDQKLRNYSSITVIGFIHWMQIVKQFTVEGRDVISPNFTFMRPCRHSIIKLREIRYKVEDLALQPKKGVTSDDMPRRTACRCWTGDTWMRLLFKSVRIGNAGNWSVLVPAGKEIKRDAVSKSDRKQRRANWIR